MTELGKNTNNESEPKTKIEGVRDLKWRSSFMENIEYTYLTSIEDNKKPSYFIPLLGPSKAGKTYFTKAIYSKFRHIHGTTGKQNLAYLCKRKEGLVGLNNAVVEQLEQYLGLPINIKFVIDKKKQYDNPDTKKTMEELDIAYIEHGLNIPSKEAANKIVDRDYIRIADIIRPTEELEPLETYGMYNNGDLHSFLQLHDYRGGNFGKTDKKGVVRYALHEVVKLIEEYNQNEKIMTGIICLLDCNILLHGNTNSITQYSNRVGALIQGFEQRLTQANDTLAIKFLPLVFLLPKWDSTSLINFVDKKNPTEIIKSNVKNLIEIMLTGGGGRFREIFTRIAVIPCASYAAEYINSPTNFRNHNEIVKKVRKTPVGDDIPISYTRWYMDAIYKQEIGCLTGCKGEHKSLTGQRIDNNWCIGGYSGFYDPKRNASEDVPKALYDKELVPWNVVTPIAWIINKLIEFEKNNSKGDESIITELTNMQEMLSQNINNNNVSTEGHGWEYCINENIFTKCFCKPK